MNLIYQSLDKFASKVKISEEAVAKIKESGITTYTSIAEAVKDAQFIVEAVPKRMRNSGRRRSAPAFLLLWKAR